MNIAQKLVAQQAFLDNAQAQGVDADDAEFLASGFALLRSLQERANFGDFAFKFATSEQQVFEELVTIINVYCKGAFYGKVCSGEDCDELAYIELADGTINDADVNAVVQVLISELGAIEGILRNAEFDDIVQTAREAMRVKYSAE